MDRTKTQLYRAERIPDAADCALTKTRIFHGVPTPARAPSTPAPVVDRSASPTVLLNAATAPNAKIAPKTTAPATGVPTTPSTTIEPDSVRDRQTRLLPIEQLLEPGKWMAPVRPSSPARRACRLVSWWRRRGPGSLARGRIVRLGVGAAALALSGYLSIADMGKSRAGPPAEPLATERDLTERVVTPQAAPEPAVFEQPVPEPVITERAPLERAPAEQAVLERPAPAPPGARRTHDAAPSREPTRARAVTGQAAPRRGPSDRNACDYLAAGDLARAAKTYTLLAKRGPNAVVYAEAARILRARLERSAP